MITLKEGNKAPNFKGENQNGEPITLDMFKGKKIILYFYPKDNTPTCTVQACNLRDNYTELINKGFIIIGISPDEEKAHKNFAIKYTLPFSLIADADHTIINKFGVWGTKKLYGKEYMGVHRTTFIINEKGMIDKIILKPKSKIHTQEILNLYK